MLLFALLEKKLVPGDVHSQLLSRSWVVGDSHLVLTRMSHVGRGALFNE